MPACPAPESWSSARANVEKVVYAPKKPVPKNAIKYRCMGSALAASTNSNANPKAPVTLMASVLQGNVPVRSGQATMTR